jgi:hypothetical protein
MEIDVRGPRLSASITCIVLVVAYLTRSAWLLAAQVVIFAVAAFAGLRWSPYATVFRAVKRLRGWGPPSATEPEAASRFSQLLGFLFAGAGLAAIVSGATGLGWGLVLVVIALSGLLAATGLCVGCEVYTIGRRLITRRAGGTPTA